MKKLLALILLPGMLVFVLGCGTTTSGPAPTGSKPPVASEPAKSETKTTMGKVTKHDGDTLMVKGPKEEHKFTIGKADIAGGKAEDLKEGAEVTVTHKGDAVSKIEITKKAEVVAPPPVDKPVVVDGKFVSYKDDKLTLMVGEKETPFDVKGITPKSDGKDIKWDELKKDDKVTVTTEKDKVTKVEKAK